MVMRWTNVIGKISMGKRASNDPMLYIRRRQDEQRRENFGIRDRDLPFFRKGRDSVPEEKKDLIFEEKSLKQRSTDKREHPRFGDGQESICYPISTLPFNVRVVDASLGGMRIQSREMIRINTDIGIVIRFKGKTAQFLVKVLWESKREKGYEYGVEYLKAQFNDNQLYGQYIANLKG